MTGEVKFIYAAGLNIQHTSNGTPESATRANEGGEVMHKYTQTSTPSTNPCDSNS
jgi:hypothetical protein